MNTLFRRLLHVLRWSRHDADLREEIEAHRTLRQAALERDGLGPDDAAQASHRAMGNVTLAVEDARDVWAMRVLDGVQQDVRAAIRGLLAVQVTDADETLAAFSPDGKWIVYRSDESGRPEIYVRDFAPDRTPAIGAGKWTISRGGGDKPRWSADGREIYYVAPDRTMMAVPVTAGATFQPGNAVPLFETNTTGYIPYAVTPDGRFLVNTAPASAPASAASIVVVLNWQTMIKPK